MNKRFYCSFFVCAANIYIDFWKLGSKIINVQKCKCNDASAFSQICTTNGQKPTHHSNNLYLDQVNDHTNRYFHELERSSYTVTPHIMKPVLFQNIKFYIQLSFLILTSIIFCFSGQTADLVVCLRKCRLGSRKHISCLKQKIIR